MLTFLLDTDLLIAAQSPDEAHHEAADQLVEAGRAELAQRSREASDTTSKTTSPERFAERREWPSNRQKELLTAPGKILGAQPLPTDQTTAGGTRRSICTMRVRHFWTLARQLVDSHHEIFGGG